MTLEEATKAIRLVEVQPGAVVSRELIARPQGTVTLFAFDAGQGLSEHTAPYDALVYILEGRASITIGGRPQEVEEGDLLIMPANASHALVAITPFKMMLVMVRA